MIEDLELELRLGLGRGRLRGKLQTLLQDRHLGVAGIDVLREFEEAPRLLGQSGIQCVPDPGDVGVDLPARANTRLRLERQLAGLGVARQFPQYGLGAGQRALKVTLGERLVGPDQLTLDVHPGVSRHLADELPEIDRGAGSDRLLEAMAPARTAGPPRRSIGGSCALPRCGPHGGGARPPQRP